MQQQNILITGSSSGMGHSASRLLAQRGHIWNK